MRSEPTTDAPPPAAVALLSRAPGEAEHVAQTRLGGVTLRPHEVELFRARLGAAATQILYEILAAREGVQP